MNKKIRTISELRKNAEVEIDETGKARLVLRRDDEGRKTDVCPFCGRRHRHGQGDGHRVSHCFSHDCNYILGDEAVFQNKGGVVLKAQDGYIIKSRFRKKAEARHPRRINARQPAYSL